MVEDFDELGIDLESYKQEEEQQLEDDFVDMEQYEEKVTQDPSWAETIGDVALQSVRGVAQAFTWPADVLKMTMIGEGLAGLDEMEELAKKDGKPFDRDKLTRDIYEGATFLPTQELLEKGIEHVTGFSLEPKTESGKFVKQLANIAAYTKGGALKKVGAGAVAAGTTAGLKGAGVGEGKAEIIGDIASLAPQVLTKSASKIAPSSQKIKSTADKYAMPFMEFMNREREPILRGKLFSATESRLKNAFNLSADQAINKVLDNQLPIKRLRDRGVNLDALATHAYDKTRQLAQANPVKINTSDMVKGIDKEISRIKALAPSPSDAQKASINLLEKERDILMVSNPTSEQLVNQHINYNSDMKSIYKKPEFSGNADEIRKTYEFLKSETINAIEKQGDRKTANAFKASNKIYHEKSKLDQAESLIKTVFDGDSYNPKKLKRLLGSKKGNFLKRNIGDSGVKELELISEYGLQANDRMARFLDIGTPATQAAVKDWGVLAPFIFVSAPISKAMVLAKPLGSYIQGKLLTRPATRDIYKLTLKHAADGAFNLLKKDFVTLEQKIADEWGSVDNFIDAGMQELEIFDED